MHQLLLTHGDQHNFTYCPYGGAGPDGGADGIVQNGDIPGLQGPTIFQFKWLWKEVHTKSKAAQIKHSFLDALNNYTFIRNWILVTPLELTPAERAWFNNLLLLGGRQTSVTGFNIYHWGQNKIEQLLRSCPQLMARYYPAEATAIIPGYNGTNYFEFANRYRTKTVATHKYLRTIGIPPDAISKQSLQNRIPLKEVFIPPRMSPERDSKLTLSINDVENKSRRRVILGDPGSGKSTLLNYIALSRSELSHPSQQSKRQSLPLAIRLRDYMQELAKTPDLTYLSYLTRRAKTDYALDDAHDSFFVQLLRMGEAIILFDGLDEVGGDVPRAKIAMSINNFCSTYPSCEVWVTSRVFGYDGDVRLPGSEFSHYQLTPVSEEQVKQFIIDWYVVQCPDNDRQRQDRIDSLTKALARNPRVKQLSGNPLLLTLMAFIHQGLGVLPQDRGELFEKCCDMLLRTWREAKAEQPGVSISTPNPFGDMHVNTLKDYLAHLAIHMQELAGGNDSVSEDGRGVISRAAAVKVIGSRHYKQSRRLRADLTKAVASVEASAFVEFICDQTGLLVDRGGDQISFIHLSFQEYLSAWHSICVSHSVDDHMSFFREKIGDQAWEEVLLLRLYVILRTPGGGGEAVFDSIITGLIRWLNDREGEGSNAWITLARAVRDNLSFVAHDVELIVKRCVNEWLKSPEFSGSWFNALEDIADFAGASGVIERRILLDYLSDPRTPNRELLVYLIDRIRPFNADDLDYLKQQCGLASIAFYFVPISANRDVLRAVDSLLSCDQWLVSMQAAKTHATHMLLEKWMLDPDIDSSKSAPPHILAAIAFYLNLTSKVLKLRHAMSSAHIDDRAKSIGILAGDYIVAVPRSRSSMLRVFGEALGNSSAAKFRHSKLASDRLESMCLRDTNGSFGSYVHKRLEQLIPAGVSGKAGTAKSISSCVSSACAIAEAYELASGYEYTYDRIGRSKRVDWKDCTRTARTLYYVIRDEVNKLGISLHRAKLLRFSIVTLKALSRKSPAYRHGSIERALNATIKNWSKGGAEHRRSELLRVLRDKKMRSQLLRHPGLAWPLAEEHSFRVEYANYHPTALVDGKRGDVVCKLNNPMAYEAEVLGLLDCCLRNHMESLELYLGANRQYISTDDEMLSTAVDWLIDNPFMIYVNAIAWEAVAERFASSCTDKCDLRYALYLSMTAYCRAMTSFSCRGHAMEEVSRDVMAGDCSELTALCYDVAEYCSEVTDDTLSERIDGRVSCASGDVLTVLAAAGWVRNGRPSIKFNRAHASEDEEEDNSLMLMDCDGSAEDEFGTE